MDPGAFDMLHDPGNEDVLSVADGVDLQFLAHEVFVDEDRILDPPARMMAIYSFTSASLNAMIIFCPPST